MAQMTKRIAGTMPTHKDASLGSGLLSIFPIASLAIPHLTGRKMLGTEDPWLASLALRLFQLY